MKRLFYLLLLFPFLSVAQVSTGQEQFFDYGIQVDPATAQTVSTPVYLSAQGIDGTIGRIPFALIGKPDERHAVNDANYTITGVINQIIAYTAITTDRTVSLPPAISANQRIWITDESGLCSNARRIIVAPNGADLIGGDSFAAITFPNGSGYLESNGAGKWNIISTTSVQFSAGVNTLPTITDNGAGGVTLGTGVYSLFANENGVGRPKAYQIAGGALSLSDQTNNYIIASYNTTTGVVSISVTTVESTINNTTVIPVYKVYRDGTTLHIADYDSLGLALSNKLQRSFEKTQPYRFELGSVLLGESATRVITVSSGNIWQGANSISLTAVASNVQTCYQLAHVAGVWTKTTVTQYPNTIYDDGTNTQTLGNGKYAAIFVFRSVGQDNDIAYVLGGEHTLGTAQTAPIPSNLPSLITSHMVFVGRIIVLKSATSATQIDSANTTGTLFTPAGITDHNALTNLQTAQTGVTYGHITDGAQTIAGDKTYSGNIVANAIDTSTTKITITTAVSITTATTDSNGIGQNSRHVVIDNGVNAINLTCNGGVTTSYGKVGSGAITFVQGSGRTLVQLSGTAILNGAVGSTASLWSNGTTDYLAITNY